MGIEFKFFFSSFCDSTKLMTKYSLLLNKFPALSANFISIKDFVEINGLLTF